MCGKTVSNHKIMLSVLIAQTNEETHSTVHCDAFIPLLYHLPTEQTDNK